MTNSFPLLWLAAFLISVPAAGQVADDDSEAEAGPVYQVEVLVFRNMDQSRTTAEISRLVEPELEDVLDQQLARLTVVDPALAPSGDETEELAFWEPAARDKLIMQADAERLRELPAYQLIGHFAWVQAADDVAVAREIATTDLDQMADLSGSFKLYRKRYLHLAVDLTLGSANDGAQDRSRGSFAQFLPVQQANPAIVDSRRMRLGRTVYFDQPEFGVLATIRQLDFDESEWARSATLRSAELPGG